MKRIVLMTLSILCFVPFLTGCSDDDPVVPGTSPEPLGPSSPAALMTDFATAYETMDFDLYMSLLHPDFAMVLQQETVDQFPTVGPTLDYAEEQQIHQRMFSGNDLTDPETGAFIPGMHAVSFPVFTPLDDWKVAKTDTTNPEGLSCPYEVVVLFDRGQDQSRMHVEGVVRFAVVAIDSVRGGEMETYYLMSGQVDLTGIGKGTESTTWGSAKALYR